MLSPQIFTLPNFFDKRGNLSFFESDNQIPFKIKRTCWIYDVPEGKTYDGHAYRKNEEFIVALSGSFDVILNDGEHKTIYTLNRSHYGLYVPPMYWYKLNNFSTSSFALVVFSKQYDENDYIHDYEHFSIPGKQYEK